MAEYKTLVKKIPVSPDKKTKQKDYLKKGRLPIVDQGQSLVGGYTDDADMAVKCELPVIVFGDHTRAVKYITFPFGAGADGIKVLQPKENILPPFLYYGTQYIVAKMPNRGYARHYQYVEKEDLPVPSLPEQERIVARIEELFSQLDAGVETLKKTKAQLSVYRQAAITEAFSVENNTPNVCLSDIAQIIGGITKGRDLTGTETIELPYLREKKVQNGYLDLSEIKTIKLRVDEKERYLLKPGDVLYTEGGDRDKLGRGTVWRGEIKDCVHQNHVFKARVDQSKAIPEYVAFWSMSTPARNYFYQKGKQSVNLASINKTVLSALTLPLPALEKQREIINHIESRLSVCDSIEQTVDTALQQAEAMRQSILTQAFGGAL